MPWGVFFFDAAGRITTSNAAASRIFGLHPEQLLGASPIDPRWRTILEDGSDCPLNLHPAIVALCTGMAAHSLVGIYNPVDDGYRWLDMTAVAVPPSAAGESHRVYATFADVTEQRRHVAAVRASEDQLRIAQKMETVGRLAGGIAHDFNNLIAAMSGYADLVYDEMVEADPSRADVNEIRRAAARAAELTSQLLAFSRNQPVRPRALDLSLVVGDMQGLLRRLIGEHIDLIVTVPRGLGTVLADRGQIEQVIMNLAVNARDAMPHGGTLVIETADIDRDETTIGPDADVTPGSYVALAVTDSGHGIDEVTQSKIFDPFFTTKKSGKGTGLGLSLVYTIAQQAGGHVRVDSVVGRGTTFTIYLPRSSAPADTARRSSSDTVRSSGGETILVVEDDTSVRELVARSLSNAGYVVLAADDGAGATQLAERHPGPIHLLLTDVVLPRTSGHELAFQLSAQMPGLRVLFMSGYLDESVTHHGGPDGETAFIAKPFSLGTLTRAVRDVLDGIRR